MLAHKGFSPSGNQYENNGRLINKTVVPVQAKTINTKTTCQVLVKFHLLFNLFTHPGAAIVVIQRPQS
jgi:hypothetical protein